MCDCDVVPSEEEVDIGPAEMIVFAWWYERQPADPGLTYADPFMQFRAARLTVPGV